MNLASAYPNNDLSVPALLAISLVMAISLALWLILVFRADAGSPAAKGTLGQLVAKTAPDQTTAQAQTAEDKEEAPGIAA
jgi:hypothetical protein